MVYAVYIDVLAVNNFFVDLAALTAVNILLKKRVRALRILSGAGIGTLGSCLAFVICPNPAAYLLAVHFLLNPLVLYFCFREKSGKVFFTDLSAGYFAFLVMGGAVEWVYADGAGFLPYPVSYAAAAMLLFFGVFWCGWKLKKYGRYTRVCICHQGEKLSLKALLDSGNLLRDPYTGRQVSMMDRNVYESVFGAPQAVRLIPYESLGCRHGLLEAVTIEKLSYAQSGADRVQKPAVLGLADHALFEKKTYQMIINPQELAKEEMEMKIEKRAGGRHEQSR